MLTINQATPKDIPDILGMMRKLCAFHGETCQIGLAEAQTRLIDSDQLTALIAHRGDAAMGYAILEPRWRPMNTTDLLEIAQLYVVETARGQGIGRQLVEAAATHARNVKIRKLRIGTSPNNPAAAAAYRAMGLEEIEVRPGAQFRVPL